MKKCEYAEKVSLYVDNELDEEELEVVGSHIAGCETCQQMEADFRYFREQLRVSARESAERYQEDFAMRKPSIWSRAISIPVPVFAGAILVLLVSFFSVLVFFRSPRNPETENAKSETRIERIKLTVNESSLERFDNGGRAEIYLISKTEVEQ